MPIFFFALTALSALFIATGAYALPLPSVSLRPVVYTSAAEQAVPTVPAPRAKPTEKNTRPAAASHIATPTAVKAIYMSQCYASSPSLREKLLKIADTTEINSIMVDIKDYTGTISFTPTNPLLVVGGKGCKVSDMRELIQDMHRRNIYVIGRITVFQDPFMVSHNPAWAVKRKSSPNEVWKDRKGLGFIDVGAKEYWDYVVALARDSHDIGFDELNFDYIRFPSDGNMADALYTHSVDGPQKGKKAEHVERFWDYLTDTIRATYTESDAHTPVLSADIFGMTATNTDDLTIGQVLERALAHFDYVAPMVYPSHYPKGFNGYDDPNKHAYGVIKYSMDKAAARAVASETEVEGLTHVPATETVEREVKNEKGELVKNSDGTIKKETKTIPKVRNGKQMYTKPPYNKEKLRTWIQDFSYGGVYGPKEVRDQIQATYDAGLTSWMVWNASNKYTVSALKKE